MNNSDIFMGFDRRVSFPIRRRLMVTFPVAFFVFIVVIVVRGVQAWEMVSTLG